MLHLERLDDLVVTDVDLKPWHDRFPLNIIPKVCVVSSLREVTNRLNQSISVRVVDDERLLAITASRVTATDQRWNTENVITVTMRDNNPLNSVDEVALIASKPLTAIKESARRLVIAPRGVKTLGINLEDGIVHLCSLVQTLTACNTIFVALK
jgi:hypothetical protein